MNGGDLTENLAERGGATDRQAVKVAGLDVMVARFRVIARLLQQRGQAEVRLREARLPFDQSAIRVDGPARIDRLDPLGELKLACKGVPLVLCRLGVENRPAWWITPVVAWRNHRQWQGADSLTIRYKCSS